MRGQAGMTASLVFHPHSLTRRSSVSQRQRSKREKGTRRDRLEESKCKKFCDDSGRWRCRRSSKKTLELRLKRSKEQIGSIHLFPAGAVHNLSCLAGSGADTRQSQSRQLRTKREREGLRCSREDGKGRCRSECTLSRGKPRLWADCTRRL